MNNFCWVLFLLCATNYFLATSFAREDSDTSRDSWISSMSDLQQHGKRNYLISWNIIYNVIKLYNQWIIMYPLPRELIDNYLIKWYLRQRTSPWQWRWGEAEEPPAAPTSFTSARRGKVPPRFCTGLNVSSSHPPPFLLSVSLCFLLIISSCFSLSFLLSSLDFASLLVCELYVNLVINLW